MVVLLLYFLFVLHGAKHFCEKFGDSWPEAGREQFDKMRGGKLHFQHVFARKFIEQGSD